MLRWVRMILWRYDAGAVCLVEVLLIRACSSETAKGLLTVLAKASEQVRAHDSLLCQGLIVMIYGMTPLCYFGMRGGVLILWGKFSTCVVGVENMDIFAWGEAWRD